MAWLGKVSLGNFPDLAGAVNKFSESVKNIEKNFDSALGFEEKSDSTDNNEASGIWPSSADRRAIFDPVMSFMGRSGETAAESSEQAELLEGTSSVKDDDDEEEDSSENVVQSASEQKPVSESENENRMSNVEGNDRDGNVLEENLNVIGQGRSDAAEVHSHPVPVEANIVTKDIAETNDSVESLQKTDDLEARPDVGLQSEDYKSSTNESDEAHNDTNVVDEAHNGTNIEEDKSLPVSDSHEDNHEQPTDGAESERGLVVAADHIGTGTETSHSDSTDIVHEGSSQILNDHFESVPHSDQTSDLSAESVSNDSDPSINTVEASLQAIGTETDTGDQRSSSATNVSDSVDYAAEVEKVKKEMKLMEAALQGAARQAQAKADEIAKLMNENEQLKGTVDNLKRKSNEADELLREEYHQRVATLERKVYALTKERDTLRREQNKKSDAAALLKEKDEIITQVMAEGEELSKKQAVQESTIRKLRAQIREFEEEKKGLTTKLQAEENKVESIKKDKATTEKFLEETIEKHQAELAAQKEHYTSALNAAKEAEAMAEARANTEARTELESRLRESGEREATLLQTLDELRQTLTRKEQQAVFQEDMLRRDIDDLQKRYHASERRCEELITQIPESTRPLLRQIEAMQDNAASSAKAWAGVERALNSRLQEAEAKAATAEENERVMNERLSQTLSRVAVLEAQISCLRAEQTQLTRSLEKERQRASESRQEYLAAQESVASYEVRVEQLEGEIKELRKKNKQELQDLMAHNELLQQEVEREKSSRLDLERHVETSSVAETSTKQMQPSIENGNLAMRKLSSSGSISSMEESYFLQASLDSSDSFSERRYLGETTPYFLKSMTPNAFEATLRQKDGELQSYMSRLASLESIRDSLAEELVKMTAQCEKLGAEAAMVPGIRAELEALRRRHSAALELMGERDEELEELRADIVDLKEMYREQVNLLVNKIQVVSTSVA